MPEYLRPQHQQGMTLVVVLLLLGSSMLMGVAAMQLALLGTRSARNAHQHHLAWQAAEAGLADAEWDIDPRDTDTPSRIHSFTAAPAATWIHGCSASGPTKGICVPSSGNVPAWLLVDLRHPDGASVQFGEFTHRTFASGPQGLQPYQAPRYLIELIEDTTVGGDASLGRDKKYIYRITSIGFGSSEDILAVTQSVYRK